ncbi:MAG: rRNA maturation RNase YbeY [Candidatus Promineifilaceae bacterium]
MTRLALDIQAETPLDHTTTVILKQTVSAVLAYEQVAGDVSLSLLLTDDEQMRQLNRDFAGLDEPTDVLSFPIGEGDNGLPDGMLPDELAGYLGDIAISMMKAERQAEKGGHPLTAELQLLTVHGVLHLLGHDHYNPEEKDVMWAAQKAILDLLGVAVTIPE